MSLPMALWPTTGPELTKPEQREPLGLSRVSHPCSESALYAAREGRL